MAVYRTDVIHGRLSNLESNLSDLRRGWALTVGTDKEEETLRAQIRELHRELETLKGGPDEFMLQSEWLRRQQAS